MKGLQITGTNVEASITKSISEFTNKNKALFVQFTAATTQEYKCSEYYVKLLSPNYNADTQPLLKFGVDGCKYTPVIDLLYRGKTYHWNKTASIPRNMVYNVYTLIIFPNNKYKLYIDKNLMGFGVLYEHWRMFIPKHIRDPTVVTPNWNNPESVAEYISNNHPKPSDWNDEIDGKWNEIIIQNPAYYDPKELALAHKAEWAIPVVPNYDYYADASLYSFPAIGGLQISAFQKEQGSTIIKSVQVTDSIEEAHNFEREWARNVDREVHRLREYKASNIHIKDSHIKDEL
jgi:hypothetical protein